LCCLLVFLDNKKCACGDFASSVQLRTIDIKQLATLTSIWPLFQTCAFSPITSGKNHKT
jgi:hypothetical protein